MKKGVIKIHNLKERSSKSNKNSQNFNNFGYIYLMDLIVNDLENWKFNLNLKILLSVLKGQKMKYLEPVFHL